MNKENKLIIKYISIFILLFVSTFGNSTGILKQQSIDLTINEAQFLKEHPVIRVYNDAYYPPFDFNVNGKAKGYSVELLEMISELAGFDIEWVKYEDRVKGKSDLNAGKIDLIHLVSKNQDKANQWNFSKPYLINNRAMYSQTQKDISNLNDVDMNSVAILRNSPERDVLLDYFYDTEIEKIDTPLDVLKAVNYKQVDYTVINPTVANYIINDKFLTNVELIAGFELGNEVDDNYYMATTSDKEALISIIDKALNTLNQMEISKLKSKWITAINLNKGDSLVNFTKEELNYIRNSEAIQIGMSSSFPPFSQAKNGKVEGFSNDLLQLISMRTGLKFEPHLNNWSSILDEFKLGKLDMIANISYLDERLEFTNYTESYYELPLMVYTRKADDFFVENKSISGKRVGIQKSHFVNNYVMEIPNVDITEYINRVDLYRDISLGKIDATVEGLASYYQLMDWGISGVKLAGEIQFRGLKNEDLRFGIKKSDKLLTSIITKAFSSITFAEMERIEKKWIVDPVIDTRKRNLKLTEKERAYLSSHQVIRVSNETDYPPFDFAVENEAFGYSIDLINVLASKIGIKVEYVNGYSWKELVELFKTHQLDILHCASKTEEREKFATFSDPYFSLKNRFVVRNEKKDVNTITELYGKRVAVGRGWSSTEYIKNNYPQIELVYYNSSLEMLKAVFTGDAYATLENEYVANYLINKSGFHDLKITGWFKEFDNGKGRMFYFMGQKNNPELISMFNKAYASLSVTEIDELQKRWFYEPDAAKKIKLTPEEQEYLNNKGTLKMSGLVNSLPYGGIDEYGNHIGVSAEIAKLMSDRLGIEIKLITTDSWGKSIENIKQRKVDIIPMAINVESRRKYMNFTKPYLVEPFVIATKDEELFIKDIKEIVDKKIGVVAGYAHKEMFLSSYPDMQIVDVENPYEGLLKVRNGEIFGYVDSLPTIAYELQNNAMVDLKIAGKLEFDMPLAVATRNDEALLLGIMQKAVNAITDSEKSAIVKQWVSVKYEKGFNYSLIWKILAVASLIIAVSIYINIASIKYNKNLSALNNEINIKNTQLERVNFELSETNEKLNLTITGANIIPMEWNIKYNIIEFGAEFGYPKEVDNTIKGFCSCVHLDDVEKVELSLKKHIRGDLDYFNEEYRFRLDSGKYIWINTIAKIMERDKNNEPIMLVGIMQNIDERKKAEHQMLRSEKLAALGKLVASVAHEINTPLGAINSSSENIEISINKVLENVPRLILELEEKNMDKLFFEMVEEGQKNQELLSTRELRSKKKIVKVSLIEHGFENARELSELFSAIGIFEGVEKYYDFARDESSDLIFRTAFDLVVSFRSINVIKRSVNNASKILYALKAYSRTDSSFEKQEFDLKESVDMALTLYHSKIKHDINLNKDYDENVGTMFGIVDELNQVWTNLIHNALQGMNYSGEMGVVIKKEEDSYVVSISDSGSGIPKEIRNRIFEPFFTTKPVGEGTGLGLDIVKKIVQNHRGEIWFETEEGEGTTFHVRLPRA